MKILGVSAVVGLTLGLASCGNDPEPASAESSWFIDSPGGGVTLTIDGVVFRPDSSVRCVVNNASATGTESVAVRTVDGHAFGVRDGVLFIGESEFGAVASGDEVVISRDGVSVNGERRGDMPAALEVGGGE